MAVRALYEMKDTPLPLAVDLYEKNIVPSISEKSMEMYNKMIEALEYDFRVSDTKEKCIFEDWSQATNNLIFTKGYIKIFESFGVIQAIWVAYEALLMVFKLYRDYIAGEMQVFSWNGNKFWVHLEVDRVIFLTPDEY